MSVGITLYYSAQSLHNGNSPLELHELYLDTSYCSPHYQTFPTRDQSEEKIWELCQKWIRKNGMFKDTRARHVVLFHLPRRYGYESILRHVFMKSLRSWQVHVSPASLTEQLCEAALAGCINTEPSLAKWIHACQSQRSVNQPLLKQLHCQEGDLEVCQIKPSTMYFTQTKMAGLEAAGQDRLVSVSQGGSNYRVCYSNHASLEELEAFVRHFSPLQITPCAIPPNSSKEEVRDILSSFLYTTTSDLSLALDRDPPTEEQCRSPSQNMVVDDPEDKTASRKRKFSSCGSGNQSDGNLWEEVILSSYHQVLLQTNYLDHAEGAKDAKARARTVNQ